MARKIITQDSVNAFMAGRPFCRSNMSVSLSPRGDCWQLALHGNVIAERYRFPLVDGTALRVTNAGWASNTTKERLNGIPGVSVVQRNFTWYLNGKEWDGSWTTV